ncbi:MAG: Na(+) antiporter subunit [Nocardioidaceae bacterium]|nr:Na(+) antiporter subunit [Nocardioidaceae bacterium]
MTLVWLLAALAAAPVLVFPLTSALGRRAGWPLAIGFLALAAAMIPSGREVLDGGEITQTVAWLPALDINLALRLDGLGLVFVMIALVIGAAVFLYSVEYLGESRQLGFYLWMAAFALGMVGLVLADDLILLFACWEITSLASFLLIARSGSGAESASARTLFMTFVGGLTLLIAVVLMIVTTGTTSMSQSLTSDVWTDRPGFTAVVAVLVAVAGFTKAAQFPFHPWLPDAMAAATPVSAYLHAAAVVKAGIYLLLRFSEAFSDVPVWNTLLISVGLFTAAMAALFAFQQHDLKRLMAYSTVSQLGLITAAIGVGTEKALTAAVIHTIAHALFKSGLFMMVGVIDHSAGTRDIRRLPELRRIMPWSFATVILGTAGMAGIPPLLGFVSKEMILGSMLEAPGPAWAGMLALAAAGAGSVLTFAYSAKIVLGAFVDGKRELKDCHGPSARLFLPAAAPIWVGLPLGLTVGVFNTPVERAVQAMGSSAAYPLKLWHGLAPELLVTAAAIAAGAALMTRRRALYRLVENDFLPGTGADALERIFHEARRLGRTISKSVAADHPRRHVVPPLIVLTLLLGVGSLAVLTAGDDVPATQPDLWRPVDVGLLVLIALGVVGTCRADSRIAATVSLGATGIAVTVQLFALGAPDVGLTQLMVEVLTVLVIMMVLRRLPGRFGHSHLRRPGGPLVLAGGLGIGAGVATWLLTGRREKSVPADYYLAEGTKVTGGDNLVNVILVEFRALDTLGELAVLGLAGVAIVAVLATVPSRTLDPPRRTHRPSLRPVQALRDPQARAALTDPQSNLRALQLLLRVVVPVLLVLSAVIFWRGHNAPGGGFIAALVASAAVALVYLSRPDDRAVGPPRVHIALIGGGVLTALATGLIGYADSSFLQPLYGTVAGTKLSTSLLFDVGVYAAVLGVVMVAFDRLGAAPEHDPDAESAAEAPLGRTKEGIV